MTQAACLVGDEPTMRSLPSAVKRLLTSGTAPTSAELEAALARLPEPYATYARTFRDQPASRTESGKPLLYFVIHDTSWPRIDEVPFPADLASDPRVNSFHFYQQAEPVAHWFVNRAGQVWAPRDISVPWRATKLESFVVGESTRGRFVHVELVQPRRRAPGDTDWRAPGAGFSAAQYRVLAALYVYASARAKRWLVPAFHSRVDAGIPEAHDDPQNFDLAAFARELETVIYSQ